MHTIPTYYLVLDANIWIAERLLYSPLGSATLFALTKSGARIGLPEVVKLEVRHTLLDQTDKAITSIKKSSQLLRHLSGHQMSVMAPSQEAIEGGITRRWNDLSGVLTEIPFTFAHARIALTRIIEKVPPCGPNNEQFRDCCIWQSSLDLAEHCAVHFVTNDHAFYDGGTRSHGLSTPLREELTRLDRTIHIYSSLNQFLDTMDKSTTAIDEAKIAAEIVEAVKPHAREIASSGSPSNAFDLRHVEKTRIIGYATPKPSLVAVSFSVTFAMSRLADVGANEDRISATLTVVGGCSHEPNSDTLSDVEISEWTMASRGGRGGWSRSSQNSTFSNQFSEGKFRIL